MSQSTTYPILPHPSQIQFFFLTPSFWLVTLIRLNPDPTVYNDLQILLGLIYSNLLTVLDNLTFLLTHSYPLLGILLSAALGNIKFLSKLYLLLYILQCTYITRLFIYPAIITWAKPHPGRHDLLQS